MNKAMLLTIVLLSGCNSNETETSPVNSSTSPNTNNSGYTVNIDPATGEFLPSAPTKTVPDESKLPQASSSVQTEQPQAAEIIPSEVPGGGEMIRLNGRFLSDEKKTIPNSTPSQDTSQTNQTNQTNK